MKRKSILMTIVAVLFAGMAMGQNWPDDHGQDVLGSDTIYFCASTDSLYPIELGYDVAGKALYPSFGDWRLAYKTSPNVKVADYNMDGTKNGGAGNAYKTVGSGYGGLIFEYTSEDPELCGLPKNKKFWVYVFILPMEDGIIDKDTILCFDGAGGNYNIDIADAFSVYKELYEAAGMTAEWEFAPTNKDIPKNVLDTYTLTNNLVITDLKADYTCGDTIHFNYVVKVVPEDYKLSSISQSICASDTLGDLGKRDPNDIFQRSYAGTYAPATIADFTAWDTELIGGEPLPYRAYTYTYTPCDGGSATVIDTLWLIKHQGDWGFDTVVYCRPNTENISLAMLWGDEQIDYPNILGGKKQPSVSQMFPAGSYWEDKGIKNLKTVPHTYDAGTTDGVSSLILSSKTLRSNKMNLSIAYNYLWRVEGGAIDCLVDPVTGLADSGVMVVILKDPAIAQDYTAQLCKPSYTSGSKIFSLNQYAGLNVVWSGGAGRVSATDGDVDIDAISKNTYKYSYELTGFCGTGTGVFYLKVTDKIKTPSSKTVKFCYRKLPGAINLNDILGVAVNGVTWQSSEALTSADGFYSSTGILNIPEYVTSKGMDPGSLPTLEFTTVGSQCGVTADTKVTIEFVDDLLN
jgi:hypothetical protein